MPQDTTFQERMQRVEELVNVVENWSESEFRTTALELVRTLMDFHGAGIERMMEITAEAGAPGYAVFDNFERDALVSNVLLLYDLHPLGIEERINKAIESVRPSLSLHEGDVEVLDVSNGVVRLRLKGSCDGCPSSALTLKQTIEEAIYAAAPDVTSIVVEGVAEGPTSNGYVQIQKPTTSVYANCEFVANSQV